jgi:hypothetical protein
LNPERYQPSGWLDMAAELALTSGHDHVNRVAGERCGELEATDPQGPVARASLYTDGAANLWAK